MLLFLSNISYAQLKPAFSASPIGELSVTVIASSSAKFIKDWQTPEMLNGVKVQRLKKATSNQLIVSAFLVSGLSPDKENLYKYTVSFSLIAPNGKAILGQKNYAKGSGVLPSYPVIFMADPALDLILEHSDPLGTYTLKATVTDLTNGKKTIGTYTIDLVNGL